MTYTTAYIIIGTLMGIALSMIFHIIYRNHQEREAMIRTMERNIKLMQMNISAMECRLQKHAHTIQQIRKEHDNERLNQTITTETQAD